MEVNMPEEAGRKEAYAHAIDLVIGAGDEMWQTISAFIVTHSIFMGFLLDRAFDSELFLWRPGPFIASIIGLLLCLVWATTLSRNTAYYRFRIAQARFYESKDLPLIADTGQRFADGQEVSLQDKPFRMPWYARLPGAKAVGIVVVVFAVGYSLIFLSTGPWW
ncbi:MAG: hypothetical protein IMZ65_04345 [Planctomycetes bacterium]|nr:hypothetical protein [Planctomycetota bacterium]